MAMLAAFIACHPAMGVFFLTSTAGSHTEKIARISDGSYSIGRAFSASLTTFVEGMMFGWMAFLFTLPIALLFGLPAHAALLKAGFWKRYHYAIAGAFMGMIAVVYYITGTQPGMATGGQSGWFLLLGGFTGLLAALLFRQFMGNQELEGQSATWHRVLFKTPHLPETMPFKSVALICAGSGVLYVVVAAVVWLLAILAAQLPIFLLSFGFDPLGQVNLFWPGLERYFSPHALLRTGISAIAATLLFIAIYAALRRMNRTGYIAFGLAGFIDGALLHILIWPLLSGLAYGAIIWPSLGTHNLGGVVIASSNYALTAIIFRALLGYYAAKEKGRNVSAPAS